MPRTRHASLGDSPSHNTTSENVGSITDHTNQACINPNNIPQNHINTPNPPDWQRVPTTRNKKRKILSQSPSPSKIETSNRFNNLDLDPQETNQSTQQRPIRPPAIILYGIEDVNKLAELLSTAAEQDQFRFKIANPRLIISSSDMEVYKAIINCIRANGLIGHTFNCKNNRCYRLVIRNLHHTTPLSAIAEEIEKTGNKVFGEIINVKYGPEKKPTSTFFVNLVQDPNNKAAKDIKYIHHQSVTIEDPKKKNTIPQCQRCQQYGHSKNYCMRPYRCVKCGESHKTSDCKKERSTPAKCALCQGPHPANHKGCEVYREILKRKMGKTINNRMNKINAVPPPSSRVVNEQPEENTTNPQQPHQSYAEAVKSMKEQHPPIPDNIERMLLKQGEKFDLILQQMSTLLSLITNLIGKLSK